MSSDEDFMPPENENFGELIKLLHRRGVRPKGSINQGQQWVQADFAYKAGKSVRQVQNWVRNKSLPRSDQLAPIEAVFFGHDQKDRVEWRMALREALDRYWSEDPLTATGHTKSEPSRSSDSRQTIDKVNPHQSRAWQSNHERLRLLLNAQIPGSTISLSRLYIRLRVKYEETWNRLPKWFKELEKAKINTRKDQKYTMVADLEDLLSIWLSDLKEPFDAIRVLRGGPGSGKSSFTKRFVQRVINDQESRMSNPSWPAYVLHVPLQYLEDFSSSLPDAIDQYLVNHCGFQQPPLKDLKGISENDRLLIVFDGLDELSRRSLSSGYSSLFLNSLVKWLQLVNSTSLKAAALVVGRDASVQYATRMFSLAPHQILHLLPYRVQDRNLVDRMDISEIDQRLEWWNNWCSANDIPSLPFPAALMSGALGELSNEPLSLYIIASVHAYDADEILTRDRNKIFELIMHRVVTNWHNRAGGETIEFQTDQVTIPLLEIIAAAAWTDGGRLTSGSRVIEYCTTDRHLQKEFAQLVATKEMAQVILAFYMKYDSISEDIGIEFTHKSFCDFLTARFLIGRLMRNLVNNNDAPEKRYSAWLSNFKGGRMTIDIIDFIKGQIGIWPNDVKDECLATCSKILSFIADPVMLKFNKGSKEERDGERVALEALFAIIAFARRKNEDIEIGWTSGESADAVLRYVGNWDEEKEWYWRHEFTSLIPLEDSIIYSSFSYFDFSKQRFTNALLPKFNFFRCNFRCCDLREARLIDCILSGADFSGANLQGAKLNGSNLSSALFVQTDLRGADLRLVNGVTRGQFEHAIFDHTTMFPSEYKMK